MKKISVAMPTYNQNPQYLSCAMMSVIDQIYSPYEIILVNDGGTPVDQSSLDFWNGLCKQKNIIFKYIDNVENKGGAHALNTAMNIMQGDCWAWLSTDDYMYPNFLEVHATLQNIKSDNDKSFNITYSGFSESVYNKDEQFIGSHDYKPVGSENIFAPYIIPQNHFFDILRKCLFNESCIFNGCCFVIDKNVLDDIGQFNEEFLFMADFEYWFRVSQKYDLLVSPQILLCRREHTNRSQYIFKDIFATKRKNELANLKDRFAFKKEIE